jgi:hypothetical protein
MRRLRHTSILVAALVVINAAQMLAQDQGPMAPPPKFEVNRIPSVPHPGPPPIPAQEIIQKFAANEDAMKKAYATYDFAQTIRIEELGDPGGKLTVTGDTYIKPDGQRYWRTTKPMTSDLKSIYLTLDDVHAIAGLPEFVLTTDEIGNYSFLYAGEDKLDEITTFVFQVKPKQLNRARRFFDGVVWVDDHDLTIVKMYGKFVSELSGNGTKYPFTMFETYRENFQDKFWLPTYTNSDDFEPVPNSDPRHLRLVIHSTGFKLNTSAAPASPGTATPDKTVPSPSTGPPK